MYTPEDILNTPEPAHWTALHEDCDTDSGDEYSYRFTVNRCDTPAKMLMWTAHLMGKVWLAESNWDEMIRRAVGSDLPN